MSSTAGDLNKDRETLKKSIEILIASIENELKRRGIQKNINDINIKFLKNLSTIKKLLDDGTKPLDLKSIRDRIERLTGEYLVSLRDSKPTNQNVADYKKGLEAVQVGIGKALLIIKKIEPSKPKPESTNWLVKNFRNVQNKINSFIQGRQTIQLQFARYKAVNAIKSEKMAAINSEKTAKEVKRYSNDLSELFGRSEYTLSVGLSTGLPTGLSTEPTIRDKYVAIFNDSPKKAIELLPTDYRQSPGKMAKFLMTPGLDETLVADYLGSEKSEQILEAYLEEKYKDSFKSENFTSSVRHFLETFKLPIEGQKIPRVMEAFARKYHKEHPGTFENADAAYVLSVAIVMLNTDAHNPNIRKDKKMTEKQFLNNLKGANNHKNFPEEMLKEIYKDITRNEIRKRGDQPTPDQGRPKSPRA